MVLTGKVKGRICTGNTLRCLWKKERLIMLLILLNRLRSFAEKRREKVKHLFIMPPSEIHWSILSPWMRQSGKRRCNGMIPMLSGTKCPVMKILIVPT